MPPLVIDVSAADDRNDIVHRAVQALAEGKLVVFPTETVYVVAANAQHPTAVARLSEIRRATSDQPLTLAIRSAAEAQDYVPEIPKLGIRIARRCWPGPVILDLKDEHPESIVRRLPPEVQPAFSPAGRLRLRVPAHPLLNAVQRLVSGPIAIAAAYAGETAEATTAQDALAHMSNQVDIVLDDGRCRFGQPCSVVKIAPTAITISRVGVISESHLRRLASWMAVIVCTGNTCRSPMGEVLLRKRLAERLGIGFEALDERGIIVMSAGLAAGAGGRAAEEAQATMQEHGLDLSDHETQPLTDRLVRFADLILTMTRGHRDAILSQWPEATGRTFLVSDERGDVSDPIGSSQEQYRRCANQIDHFLADWVAKLDANDLLGEFLG